MHSTLKSANKGMLKTLEAVIAILMILTVFFIYFGSKGVFPEFSTLNTEWKGFYALKNLDESNKLRSDALANNTVSIQNNLQPLLPPEVSYQVFICQTNCGKPAVNSEKMISVTYFIAGDIDNYSPRQIILYMW